MTEADEASARAPKPDGLFSRCLMLPFRVMTPPILDTPLSTVPIPPTLLTIPIVLISFGAMVGGSVYCWVNHVEWYFTSQTHEGKTVKSWMASGGHSIQSVAEAWIVGGVFGLGGLSLIAAYYALVAQKKTGVVYAYVYRYAMTFPVWAILAYEVYKLKLPGWKLELLTPAGRHG
jgi:hypothetical protein